ncbi:hypothetical protein P5G50_18285 [Leifsonia sp. F6_8S_P_1B]|uniref:Uncharacterized protein n=1 Tax=Leifsonia williamsii TaxID=3035919 RepID=A0ABT8KG16_9MICO|nr:hypothetical protein [Leifsonia williamsii]MDN4616400.1 hypothetical protein [Leifsonia williamsii]
MGYSEGTSLKGLDVFNSTPQTVADLNRLRELIELVGNVREGTVAEMNALVAPQKYPGLMFFANDDGSGALYVCLSNLQWMMLSSARQSGQPTMNTPYTLGSGAGISNRFVKRDGEVRINAQIVKSAGVIGVGETVMTLPVGFRPYATMVTPACAITNGGNFGFITYQIQTNGAVTVQWLSSQGSSPTVAWLEHSFETV